MVRLLTKYGIMSLLLFTTITTLAQDTKVLSLNDAISLGLANSKTLQLSKVKVEQAVSNYKQTLDLALPSAKVSAIYNHVEIPNNTLQIGAGNPIKLPSSADAYLGTLSIEQLIFAGNKLKYAKESTDLLKKVAELDVENNKEEITLSIINAYLNLYKLEASKKVIQQNLEALDKQYQQTERFFEQGLVTKNDVLRLQLQKSNVELTGLDLDRNQKIVNYNLNILLGLPESTKLQTAPLNVDLNKDLTFSSLIDSAINNRVELKQITYRSQIADKNIASLKADALPTLGAGLSTYYVNPSGKFIPPMNQFITPVSLGVNLSWNIASLWTNKNKVAGATIQKREVEITKNILLDNLKLEVNRNYENYVQSLNRIKLITTAIEQATENDKIVQSKYNNNIASMTDRIDADTQLFQTKINLEIAKADAEIAYFNLLKSAGQQLTR
ncbi:TolC family protein [Pelobium sp.]|nr:TolC family protein [Pelobium sp.]